MTPWSEGQPRGRDQRLHSHTAGALTSGAPTLGVGGEFTALNVFITEPERLKINELNIRHRRETEQ